MLIHLTRSLLPFLNDQVARKYSAPEAIRKRSQEQNSIWQWHAHRFPYANSCCVLLCHDDTGYILSFPGVEASEYEFFPDMVRENLMASVEDLGFSSSEARQLLLQSGPVVFDDQSNNKTKEMLSVAWQDLHNLLEDRPNLLMWNPLRLNEMINQRIIKKGGQWCRPDDLFSELIASNLFSSDK